MRPYLMLEGGVCVTLYRSLGLSGGQAGADRSHLAVCKGACECLITGSVDKLRMFTGVVKGGHLGAHGCLAGLVRAHMLLGCHQLSLERRPAHGR